ncbi:M23 family metallopeptidase [Microbacterium immunditiarum]|uniref:Murein DD-endopeptidase MepM/ murein hydrolase activator NlpD n=1 Tax=Microbacterium immunditiarum TaxID=337480 RepID=A0A7Y9GKN5_9MICO|nr:M23 family metallopeptidase [Microbacterium immunditiarum]NYE18086.1 murein DD-endopeptidase MepM/ murein hydrolase activator NlpD [Microbacterium immunditiarum]
MPAPVIVKGAAVVASRSRLVRKLALFLAIVGMALLVGTASAMALPIAVLATGTSANAVGSGEGSGLPEVSGDWGYPLAGGYTKGRGFGYHPVHGCSFCSSDHKGYDMAQGCGARIFATGPGRVTIAGAHYGWGNTVIIDHGRGIETLYGHMQWDSIRVHIGQRVETGTVLGAEGNTGNSFGCHLHFEVRVDGTAVPPERFMAARGLPLQ